MQLKGPTSLNGDCLAAPERLRSETMHTQRASASQKRAETHQSHPLLGMAANALRSRNASEPSKPAGRDSPVALHLLGSILKRITVLHHSLHDEMRVALQLLGRILKRIIVLLHCLQNDCPVALQLL